MEMNKILFYPSLTISTNVFVIAVKQNNSSGI